MPDNDPFATLATGLSEDHKAEKRKRKPKDEPAAELKADPAAEQARVEAERPTPADRVNLDTPAAPGDDAQSVLDRRLERLDRIIVEQPFGSGTALGDLTDCILDLYKHRPSTWAALDSNQQRDTIRYVQGVAKDVIRKLVVAIASEDVDTIQATFLPQFAVKGEAVEAKIKIDGVDNELLGAIFGLAGHRVVIVSADEKAHSAVRREPVVDPDQHRFKFEEPVAPATPATEAPTDDSDLNPDDDDDESGVDAAIDATLTHGIFDNATSEWLADQNEAEDVWTDQASDAKRFTEVEANRLVNEMDAGSFEAMALDESAPAAPDTRTHGDDSAVND